MKNMHFAVVRMTMSFSEKYGFLYRKSIFQLTQNIFLPKMCFHLEIWDLYKSAHHVDLCENFQMRTSIYLQTSVLIQARTSPRKFGLPACRRILGYYSPLPWINNSGNSAALVSNSRKREAARRNYFGTKLNLSLIHHIRKFAEVTKYKRWDGSLKAVST